MTDSSTRPQVTIGLEEGRSWSRSTPARSTASTGGRRDQSGEGDGPRLVTIFGRPTPSTSSTGRSRRLTVFRGRSPQGRRSTTPPLYTPGACRSALGQHGVPTLASSSSRTTGKIKLQCPAGPVEITRRPSDRPRRTRRQHRRVRQAVQRGRHARPDGDDPPRRDLRLQGPSFDFILKSPPAAVLLQEGRRRREGGRRGRHRDRGGSR